MRYIWLVAAGAMAITACREPDGPMGGGEGGVLVVESDPSGGRITLDGKSTGKTTPDTLRGVAGVHDVIVELDTMLLRYRYAAQVVVTGTEPVVLNGPLMARCQQSTTTCSSQFHQEHVVGNVRFGTNALGPLFLQNGQGRGLYWPGTSDNSYLSTATPIFAASWDGQQVATGIYDTEYFAGRPTPGSTTSGSTFRLSQTAWLLPPLAAAQLAVARGIEVQERMVASTTLDGVFLIELTFRNISSTPLYGIVDQTAASLGGISYDGAYIGLALDPDIGEASDDWASYDPDLATVYAYDASFAEADFTTEKTSPALVGLRVLRSPAGTHVVLNSWANTPGTSLDWQAGTNSQFNGYGMVTGTASYPPDHPSETVGTLPPSAGDVRIMATVGPLQLPPGSSATVVLALALAPPAVGSYTSGEFIQPGEPTDASRKLYGIAAGLRAKLQSAEQLLALFD